VDFGFGPEEGLCALMVSGDVGVDGDHELFDAGDMDFAPGIGGNDPVHEIAEFDTPASLVVAADDLAAGDVQRGEQRHGPMPLIVMRLTGHRPSVEQLQIACARSSAWMEGFSSTASAMALSGGAIYRARKSRPPWP